jgi:adhesin transport system outer membrane protein
LNVVLRFSPTLKRLEEERNAALKDVDSKRAVLYPNVSVRYEKLSGALSVIPIDHWMVVLDYVPGAGLSSFSAIGAAVKRAEMAGNAMVAGQRDVTERTFNQYSDARSFIDQLEPARAYAKASADVMASYLRQYTTGRKSWLDVMNAQREQTQARYAELDAFAGGVLAVLKLEILAGRVTRATVQAEPTKLP